MVSLPRAAEAAARCRVLLVEDDPGHQLLVRRAFAPHGDEFELQVAGTLAAARAAIAAARPHLLIADLVLPDGRGVELVVPTDAADFPVVIMTGQSNEAVAVDAMKAGALDYLVKSAAGLVGLPAVARRALREWTHIQQKREAQRALRASEQRFRALFDEAPIGMAIIDDDFRISRANAKLAGWLGYTREEMRGLAVAAITHPDDVAKGVSRSEGQQGQPHGLGGLEKRYVHRDGSIRWGQLSATMLRGPGGGGYGLGAVVDLTRQKEVAEELRRRDEQLRHAQKMEAIGRLAGSIAHDFNNILAAIASYGELLAEVLPPGSEARDDAEQIRAAVARGAALTRQLLSFGRKQELSLELVRPSHVLQGLSAILERLAREDVELNLQCFEPTEGVVRIDPGQLEQVLVNLAVNGCDAMPTGGELRISVTDVADPSPDSAGGHAMAPGCYVRIVVADQGAGIAPEVLPHIFEPFFTTKGPGHGTGLGLATCWSVVHEAGGCIWAEPGAAGRGTAFGILLPCAAPPEEGRSRTAIEREPNTTTPSPELVLLVEDQRRVRAAVTRQLRGQGHVVVEAGDAAEALRLVDKQELRPTLVICDVLLPGMKGPELVRALLPRLRRVPEQGDCAHERRVDSAGLAVGTLAHLGAVP